MKNLFVALVFVLGFTTVQASTIVKAVMTPGFTMNPETRTFLLDSSGLMQKKILIHQTGQIRFIRLGQLSAYTTNELQKEVKALDIRSPLVDEHTGQPTCMDSGGLSISIIQGKAQKEIFRQAECHEFHLASFEGRHIIKLAMGFIEL